MLGILGIRYYNDSKTTAFVSSCLQSGWGARQGSQLSTVYYSIGCALSPTKKVKKAS